MLPNEYKVPNPVEETTKFILYSRKNGDFLGTSYCDRCEERTSGDFRISVDFKNTTIDYYEWDDGDRTRDIGLAVSRELSFIASS